MFLLIIGPPVWVGIYRFVEPPITILMVERLLQGQGIDHKWAPISHIAPAMARAVVASEDANFCTHGGFDLHAIDAALKHNQARPNKLRGGSTISQQTAKNVFLWPERSWVRKGAEAWFTILIEKIWGKRRIMEVYLNTVEMGPGMYGVETASERYFGITAENLSPSQASRLAAILPDPLKWKVENPGPYVQRRTGRIDARSSTVARGGLAACVLQPTPFDLPDPNPPTGKHALAAKARSGSSPAAEKPDRFLDPVPPFSPTAPAEPSVPPQLTAPTVTTDGNSAR